jgi:hypothetical protein
MALHRTRWTVQVQSRREFLERSMIAAAWAGLTACSGADLSSPQERGRPLQTGGAPQDGGAQPAAHVV